MKKLATLAFVGVLIIAIAMLWPSEEATNLPSGEVAADPPDLVVADVLQSDATQGVKESDARLSLPALEPGRYRIVGRPRGSLAELLAREADGDVDASYEIVARSIACRAGNAPEEMSEDCGHETMEPSYNLIRLIAAAENGSARAQENFVWDYFPLVDATGGDLVDLDEDYLVQSVGYLKEARNSGSAMAIFTIGFLATNKKYGVERVENELIGVPWTEAVGHLIAARDIFNSTGERQGLIEYIDREELLLAEWELEEANAHAEALLETPSCCFLNLRE